MHLGSAEVPARLGRAAAFAAASVCLAVAAHAAGSGDHPSAPVLVVAVGLLTRICHGLAGRERGNAEVALGVGATQFALHHAFAIAAHPAGHGHAHHHVSHGSALVPSVPMVCAHVLAAGVIVAALRHAERCLWTAAALRSLMAGAARAGVGAAGAVVVRFTALIGVLCAADSARSTPAPNPTPAQPSAAPRAGAMLGRTSRRRGPPTTACTGPGFAVAAA